MISVKSWLKPLFLPPPIKTQDPAKLQRQSRIHQLRVMLQFNSIISIINNNSMCSAAAYHAYINKYFIRICQLSSNFIKDFSSSLKKQDSAAF